MEQMITIANRFLPVFSYLFLALMFIGGAFRIAELTQSARVIRKHVRSLRAVDYRRFQDSEHMMPVSLILPAVGMDADLSASVQNLLALEFKQYELIVVANSEQKQIWDSLKKAYHLLPFHQPYKKTLQSSEIRGVYRSADDVRLIVLDQAAASRADALNAGVNVSSYPIIAVSDPDLRLSKDALLKAIYAFVGDPNCVFIGSFPRVGTAIQGEGKLPVLGELQGIERLRMLYTHRRGYETLGLYLPLQATFAAFLKSAIQESGGFSAATTGEIADLLLRLHARFQRDKRTYSAPLMPEAVCYQMPQRRMKAVCDKRRREQATMRSVLMQHRSQNRSIQALSYTRFAETGWPRIEWIGALVVALSALLGAVPPMLFVSYLGLSILMGSLQSLASVLLEESAFQRQTDTGLLLKRYALSILENCYYRPRVTLAKLLSHGK